MPTNHDETLQERYEREHRQMENRIAEPEAVRLNAQAVPDGWKLVPIEPTDEMVKSAHAHHEGSAYLPHSLYAAMLAAAPAAPHPAAPVHPGDDAMFELWWADHMPNASQAAAWAEWCSLRANQPEPQPAAQQGEIAWPAIPATVRRDVTMLAGYAEGSKSAEIVNTVRRVIDWLNADRIAAQAQEAAPAAQGEPLVWKQDASYLDVVQQRMTWSGIPVLVTGRVVTHHGNWPLIDAARAAQQKGGAK